MPTETPKPLASNSTPEDRPVQAAPVGPRLSQEPDRANAEPASLADLLQELRAIRRQLARGPVDPELLRAPDAARLAGVSTASWARLVAAGKTPRSIKLGGCVGWRRSELLEWIAAGCPDENAWRAFKGNVPQRR